MGKSDIRRCKDKSVTVRFNSEVADVIDELAGEYKVTRSEIIRLAAENSLARYLDHVKYMDLEQGNRIRHDIARLGTAMGETLYNLRRIGANFDQLLHRVNASQVQTLQRDGSLITREELDSLITRLEHTVEKVGDDLHVFTD